MDELDDIIKNGLSTEKPESNFSDAVMKQIRAMEEKEELAMTALFNRYALEYPSDRFTDIVMNKVRPVVKSYRPLISKRSWIFISVVAMVVLILAMTSGENNPSTFGLYFEKFIQKSSTNQVNLFLNHIFGSRLLALAMFVSSLLMALDYLLRSKKLV